MSIRFWITCSIVIGLVLPPSSPQSPQGFPLVENFDSVGAPALPAGWSALVAAGLSTNNWRTVTTQPDTAPNDAFAPAPSTVHDIRLITPAFYIGSTTAQVYFRQAYDFELGYDGGVLEISYNGGPFTDILAAGGNIAYGGYTSTLSSNFLNPLGGRAAWSGASGYYPTVVDLPSAAAGSMVQLQWRMGTDSSTGTAGWRIDSITVADNQDEFAPTILSSYPTDQATNFPSGAKLVFNFSEPVNLFPPLLELLCNASGPHDSTLTSDTLTMTITPVGDLIPGEDCQAVVLASQVADMDPIDPPDRMLFHYVVNFRVATGVLYLPLMQR